MERVSQILKLAVIIKRGGPPSFELQALEEFDFLGCGIAAQ